VCHFEFTHLVSKRSAGLPVDRLRSGRNEEPAEAAPTPRELQVEDLLCRGYSQENIAAIFGRSVSTISVHVTSLYRKRGVHSQVGLLLAYLERKGIFAFGDETKSLTSRESLPVEAV
jgi:DNA-binding NarL/FixJ family response regulator